MVAVPVALVAVPRHLAPRSLPGHRAMTAVLVNASAEPQELDARDFSLHDAAGRRLRAAVQFDGVPHAKCAQLAPGARVALTAGWRGEPAAEVRFGGELVRLLAALVLEGDRQADAEAGDGPVLDRDVLPHDLGDPQVADRLPGGLDRALRRGLP